MFGRTRAFGANHEPQACRGTGGPSIGHAHRNRPPRGDSPTHRLIPIRQQKATEVCHHLSRDEPVTSLL